MKLKELLPLLDRCITIALFKKTQCSYESDDCIYLGKIKDWDQDTFTLNKNIKYIDPQVIGFIDKDIILEIVLEK